MALEKAKITPEGEAPIPVLFNPKEYSLNQANTLNSEGAQGLAAPILQYAGGNGRTLGMTLFFDTYEARSDVRKHTDLIYGLLNVRGPLHRPPICTFTWGSFNFRCMLESVNGSFTLFLPDGTPVRATLTVSFKELSDVERQVRNPPTESADHAKTYLVRRGDTLSSIAGAEYGDPALWRPIADANHIANPRILPPGTRLSLPAIT